MAKEPEMQDRMEDLLRKWERYASSAKEPEMQDRMEDLLRKWERYASSARRVSGHSVNDQQQAQASADLATARTELAESLTRILIAGGVFKQ